MSKFYSSLFVSHKFPHVHQVVKPRYNKEFFKRINKSLAQYAPQIRKRSGNLPLLSSDNLKILMNGSKELLSIKNQLDEEGHHDYSDPKQVELRSKLATLEEKLMPIALAIPNRWSQNVPEEDIILDQVNSNFLERQDLFKTLSHTKLSFINNCYSKSIVGPNSHYYYGIGAKLQYGLANYFANELENHSFIPLSGLSLTKSAIVEAANSNDYKNWSQDPSRVIVDDDQLNQETTLHVTEASRESIVAFLTTLGHVASNEPIKFMLRGVTYRSGSFWFDPDTKKVSQLNTVHALIQSPSIEQYSMKHYQQLKDQIWSMYRKLELPCRLVQCSLSSMNNNEYDAHRVDVWLPSRQDWIQTGRISHYLDYITIRSGIKRGHLIDSSIYDGQAMVAAIIENKQTSNGTFKIPQPLEPNTPGLSDKDKTRYFNLNIESGGLLSNKPPALNNYEQRRYLVKKSYAFSHAKKVYKTHFRSRDRWIALSGTGLIAALIDWTELWNSVVPTKCKRFTYDKLYRPVRRLWWAYMFRRTTWRPEDLSYDELNIDPNETRSDRRKKLLYELEPRRQRDYTKPTQAREVSKVDNRS